MSYHLAFWLFLLSCAAVETSGCVTNPYTKRWQLLMVPQSYEMSLGTQAYHDVLSDPRDKGVSRPSGNRSGATGSCPYY